MPVNADLYDTMARQSAEQAGFLLLGEVLRRRASAWRQLESPATAECCELGHEGSA